VPTPSTSKFLIPKSWDEFEDIVADVLQIKWQDVFVQRYGRTGQKQYGVDIYSTPKTGGRYDGAQCKNKMVSINEIKSAIMDAERFRPPLGQLVIAVGAPRDGKLQEDTRNISLERTNEGKFSVVLLFWDEIVRELTSHPDLVEKHFPLISTSNQTTALGIDRLEKDIRTHYERMIARMETWEYYPSSTGLMIRLRYNMDNPSNYYTDAKGVPADLKQDMQHLRFFGITWDYYRKGRVTVRKSESRKRITQKFIRKIIATRCERFHLTEEQIVNLSDQIISRTISKMSNPQLPLVEWGKTRLDPKSLPEPDGRDLFLIGPSAPTDFKMIPEEADALLTILKAIEADSRARRSVGITEIAKNRVAINQADFKKSLQVNVIERCKNSVYSYQTLRKSYCEDCKPLKSSLMKLQKKSRVK